MAVPEVTRVNYYSHQYLGVADFQAQQAYHRDMRRRHNLGPHLWGIVVGLELEAVDGDAGVEVWLSPGMATDGYGREIVVLRRERLDPTLFAGIDEEGYRDVSIAYRERLGSPPSAQLAACDVPDQYSRVRETHRLLVALHPTTPELTVDGADAAATDASLPQDASVPFQEFPPDATEWPVRLGSVWWDRQTIAKPPTGDVVDLSERRYIGLTSARVYAPANAEALLLSKLVSGPIRFETGGGEHEHDTVRHRVSGGHRPVEHPTAAQRLELLRFAEPRARASGDDDRRDQLSASSSFFSASASSTLIANVNSETRI